MSMRLLLQNMVSNHLFGVDIAFSQMWHFFTKQLFEPIFYARSCSRIKIYALKQSRKVLALGKTVFPLMREVKITDLGMYKTGCEQRVVRK